MRKLLALLLLLIALMPARADVKLRDGDVIELRLSGVAVEYIPEFTNLVITVDDGKIGIPHIGRIQAAGSSTSQLAVAIEKSLRDAKIFANPTIVINMVQNQRFVVIGGAVRGPGKQLWSSVMTLTTAIAAAQGPADFADDKVKIIRGGKTETYSRKAIKKDPSTDPKVLPDDFIEIQGEY
jgi:polysaccharide export outer membrane protein